MRHSRDTIDDINTNENYSPIDIGYIPNVKVAEDIVPGQHASVRGQGRVGTDASPVDRIVALEREPTKIGLVKWSADCDYRRGETHIRD